MNLTAVRIPRGPACGWPDRTNADRDALAVALLAGLDADALREYAVGLTAELLFEADHAERLDPRLASTAARQELPGHLLTAAWIHARSAHRAPWGVS